MKVNKVLDAYAAILKWHRGDADIQELVGLIGDDHNEVGRMLMLNGIADFNYKPVDGFSKFDVICCVLLYLCMVQGKRIKK